jgi:DNA-directed RNA polymerase specialized sigma24 family protein
MSPLTLRRYRAERLLKSEFEGLQGRVLATVGRRLRGAGVELDPGDIECCYAMAWQGLYGAVLDGQQIDNPAGWLVTVTFRRAIEEHRARARTHRGASEPDAIPAGERDLAAELDDRVRLRQLFEGLRAGLSAREREAAVLCYLQGLPRAQAAARMGVSEARMRKLMEGRGPGRPGVASKVGALVETIRDGNWCEQQGSLMRGLAFGILDPKGERYQLALLHRSECPACRAYVTSLRGLAAVFPPVLLPGGLGAAALGAGAVSGAGASGGAGAQLGHGLRGTLSASSSAGTGAGGAVGGGWLVAGTGKLALGCALALGVGSGCIALDIGTHSHAPAHRHHLQARTGARSSHMDSHLLHDYAALPTLATSTLSTTPSQTAPAARLTPAGKASREFGLEASSSPSAAAAASPALTTRHQALARTASSSGAAPSGATDFSPSSSSVAGAPSPSGSAQAAREFSPG